MCCHKIVYNACGWTNITKPTWPKGDARCDCSEIITLDVRNNFCSRCSTFGFAIHKPAVSINDTTFDPQNGATFEGSYDLCNTEAESERGCLEREIETTVGEEWVDMQKNEERVDRPHQRSKEVGQQIEYQIKIASSKQKKGKKKKARQEHEQEEAASGILARDGDNSNQSTQRKHTSSDGFSEVSDWSLV